MKPIIKYRGGKSKELHLFKEYIPQNFETYFEPFLGGGATYFDIEPRKAYVADINENLIKFYIDLRENFHIVKQELKELEELYKLNRETFMINKKILF
ncbi:DNA adenine methylase [Staphylococcus pseudintermedius]|uniref:DNA adenine methylase n=1 Tax=Staphylococcus pseudintermedius TaxID=283734 RepID=UPI00286E51C9|nr:DNA adenine methylase [Staphylococcus pseudintermedius]WMZ77953.1 DNA adenine methylase [Staphylococcus pseudintermedius]